MAFVDSTFYLNFGDGSTTGYYAVTVRPQNTAVAAGVLRRQFTAPAVGSERVFVCIVAGTTANTTDATWTTTRGAKTTDGTATWQECTGVAAINGDATNTPTWSQTKTIAASAPSLGQIIKRNNGASYWICSTAGAMGASEPAWANNTAGTTQADSTTTWTCLGVVGNFSGGGAPFARMATVISTAATWLVSTTINYFIYVGDNHAETQSTAMTISFNVAVLPVSVLCHNHSSSYPPAASDLTTGASLTTSGNTQLTIQLGNFNFYGITFLGSSAGVSATDYILVRPNSTGIYLTFDNCSFRVNNSVTNASMTIGDASLGGSLGFVTWNNCTVSFGDVSQRLAIANCRWHWKNTGLVLASGSSVPVTMFVIQSTSGILDTILEALDLSQLTGNLVSNGNPGQILVKDCKLNASLTPTAGTIAAGFNLQFIRSDSGATAYKSARYAYEATETTETSITRVGGASDPTGQAQSRKIATSSTAAWLRSFKAEPYAIWNPTTGANVIVTVYGTINAGALPNNDDIWMEVEYLGSASFPIGTIVNTTKATVLSANAAVASDGSTWNGGGSGAGWSPFKLTTTLSSPQPGIAGYIEVRARVAKPSTTYYLDPKIVLS